MIASPPLPVPSSVVQCEVEIGLLPGVPGLARLTRALGAWMTPLGLLRRLQRRSGRRR